MDILSILEVRIDTGSGEARPTIMPTFARPNSTWKIPARTSMIFKIHNPFYCQSSSILFEPSDSLPSQIRSTSVVGEGKDLYI